MAARCQPQEGKQIRRGRSRSTSRRRPLDDSTARQAARDDRAAGCVPRGLLPLPLPRRRDAPHAAFPSPKSRQISPGERSSGRSGRLLHSGRGSARYMVVKGALECFYMVVEGALECFYIVVEGALECFYIVVEGALECFVAAEGAAAVRHLPWPSMGRAPPLASSPSCIAARARRPSSHAPSACSMRPSREVFREFELPKCLHQRMRFEQVVACNPRFDSLSECGRLNLPTP